MTTISSLQTAVGELLARVEALESRLRISERRVAWGALSYPIVADKLGVQVRTLRRWVKDGKFPRPVRHNQRCHRFRAADVQAFIEGEWQT